MWPHYRPRSRARNRLSAESSTVRPEPALDRVTVDRSRLCEDVGEEMFWHWSWLLAPETTLDLTCWA